MKLTGILLVAAVLQVAAAGRAQTVTCVAHSVPLERIFTVIEQETGYVFFYDKDQLREAHAVTVELRKAPLAEALDSVFVGQPLTYEITGNTIVVSRRKVQLTAPVVAAPPGEVRGKVVDSTGAPLAGASVSVKGSKKGAQTDARGEFVLKGVEEGAMLVVSFTGYEQQVVRSSVDHALHVVLKHSDNPLDQVQIIAYGTSSKRFLTGDVSTVKSAEIEEQPVTDPLLALEGRVPGLYIQQTSGVPGAYSTVRIMGQNSIANGNDPLYVVDGVPYSSQTLSMPNFSGGAVGNPTLSSPFTPGLGMSPFNALNPADIESIDVLKDAAATAIYGSRGANGVILITTKKGKAGKTRVDANVYTGSSKVTRRLDLLNTQQYLEMRREAFQNDGLVVPSISTTPKDNNYDIDGLWDTTRYTDWQKVLIGNLAHFSNAELTISGGNTNTQFLVGGGYSIQGTVFPGNFFDKKGSAHLSITHSSSDQRFHLQATASYVNDNNELPNVDLTGKILLAPDAPALYDANGNLNWQMYNGTSSWVNPLEYLAVYNTAVTNNLVSNLNLDYEVLPGLRLKGNAGYTHNQMNQHYIAEGTLSDPPPANIPSNSVNEFGTTDFQTWILEPQVTYQKQIAKGKLDALVGSTFQQNVQSYQNFTASNFTSDALINNPLSAASTSIHGYGYTLYHYAALFGRLGYNWDKKYLIEITGRRDGSSRFGPGKQFGDFGSVGAGWIFSSEPFVAHRLDFLSFGKLRTSYGTTGNDQITDYQYLSTYSALSGSNGYQNNVGLYPTRIANPYFSWELVKKIQVGLDLGFLKDRLLFSGTYYRNRDNNQLVGYPLSLVTGFSTIQANFPALVQNTGEEVSLTAVILRRDNFSWSSTLNLTVPQNKLVSYPNFKNSPYANTYFIGHSLFSTPEFQYSRVNPQNGVYQFYSPTYKTDTSNPAYPADLVPSRPITQSLYGAFQNSLSYKGIQLDIFIQFVKQAGYNYADYMQTPGSFVNKNSSNELTAVLSRWREPGDNDNVGKFSTKASANPYGNLSISNYVVSDASFLRLKNISLSYQLPGEWQKKARMQTARIYMQCQNLFTWTRYLGMDPETQGVRLPPLRTLTGGIQIGF